MKKIFLFSLFFANTAFAASDSTTFSGNISLQGNYQSGNFNTITLGGKLNSSLSKKKNNLDLVASYRNTQIKIADDFVKKEDEKYSLLAYSKVIGKYKLIALNENEISFLRKIEMRNSFGVGMGYKFVKTDKTEFEISEVILSESSRYKETSLDINTFRSSTRFKFLYNSYPFNLSCIWFLQPPLWSNKEVGYKDNLNVRANTTFDVNLTKKFLIGISEELIVQTYANIMVGKKISPYDNSITVYVKYTL